MGTHPASKAKIVAWLLALVMIFVSVIALSQPTTPGGFVFNGQVLKRLDVSKIGSGTGTVTGNGINCGSDCSQDYPANSQIDLSASAAGGSAFTGWSGACTGTGTCPVTMSDARAVTAAFDLSGGGELWATMITDSSRATRWTTAGMMSVGGIPSFTQQCGATLSPGATGIEDSDDIQTAINNCPTGQFVQLSAGTFRVNDPFIINRAVVLRGAGGPVSGSGNPATSLTILEKTDGACVGCSSSIGPAEQVLTIGPATFANPEQGGTSYNLAADGVKGSTTITLSSVSGLVAGEVVILDELHGATFRTGRLDYDNNAPPGGNPQVWASVDYLLTWKRHSPSCNGGVFNGVTLNCADDPFFPGAETWFSRSERPRAEMKEIASINAGLNQVTFTSMLHNDYRVAQSAQIFSFIAQSKHLKTAGMENLRVTGGSNHNIRVVNCAYCWFKNVECDKWLGHCFSVANSFRVEFRQVYIHDAAWANPGGGGYAWACGAASSEMLIEDSIHVRANKTMTFNACGAGSVLAYSYFDQSYINTNSTWIEAGMNASHFVASNTVLFEGNYTNNFESDYTHGGAIRHTIFRNWISGFRASFTGQAVPGSECPTGCFYNDRSATGCSGQACGPKRAAGASAYSYEMNYIGNVLGEQGSMTGWILNHASAGFTPSPTIWMLGWEGISPQPYDNHVERSAFQHGNWNWLPGAGGGIEWSIDKSGFLGPPQGPPANPNQNIPNSFYLTAKPAFFGNCVWPWVDSVGATKTRELPAKRRFDGLGVCP